jgi:oligopeptide transport system substrate-binding protein
MTPRFVAGPLLLAGCVALAGCSRVGTNVSTGDRDQVLHRGIAVDLADLDPQLATDTTYYTVLSSLLEGLVSEDPVDLHPVPGAAERWDVSPDGLTYTFYLRAGALWSDGTPLTSQDFIASWNRILTPAFGATYASMLYVIQGAEAFNRGDGDFSQVGLHAPDARTLTVTLEHRAPWFLSMLSSPAWMPVPIATLSKYGSVTQRGNPWAIPGRWVGNGPFVLKEWDRGQQIVVSKSPTYWDAARVRLREIHFHFFDSVDSEERAFRSGQLHVTEALPAGKIGTYRKDAPNLLRLDPLLGTLFIRLNVRRPGLEDPRVRQALAFAIDRTVIVDRVLRGGQRPAFSFTPPGLGGYEADPVQRLQLDEATRLLAESGHPGGAGLPVFELLYVDFNNYREVVEAVQEMWRRDLGVQVRLVNEELKSTEEARRAGAYDLLLSSWIADYAEPSAFLDMWRGDSGNNFTGWSNPDYDALIFKSARTPDSAGRDLLYGNAERMLLGDAPIIPIYHYTHVFLIQPSVRGWNSTLLDHHPYKDVWLGD